MQTGHCVYIHGMLMEIRVLVRKLAVFTAMLLNLESAAHCFVAGEKVSKRVPQYPVVRLWGASQEPCQSKI